MFQKTRNILRTVYAIIRSRETPQNRESTLPEISELYSACSNTDKLSSYRLLEKRIIDLYRTESPEWENNIPRFIKKLVTLLRLHATDRTTLNREIRLLTDEYASFHYNKSFWIRGFQVLLSMRFFNAAYLFREKAIDLSAGTTNEQNPLSPVETVSAAFDKGDFDTARCFVHDPNTPVAFSKYLWLVEGKPNLLHQMSVPDFTADDQAYFELVGGKSIALVGPTQGEAGNGEEIDGFDIVIRSNYRGADYIGAPHRTGSRTNISYNNASYAIKTSTDAALPQFGELDFVVYKNNRYKELNGKSHPDKSRSAFSPSELYFTGHANMLPIIVFDLFHFLPAKVKIFNATFFLSRNQYFEGYESTTRYNRISAASLASHDLLSQFNFMRNLWNANLFEADKELAEVLRLTPAGYMQQMEELYCNTPITS